MKKANGGSVQANVDGIDIEISVCVCLLLCYASHDTLFLIVVVEVVPPSKENMPFVYFSMTN